jgi:hypothetical protein
MHISKTVRDAIRERLADAESGFNAVLASLAPDYGVIAFDIDWTADSRNFFQGALHPDQLEQSSPSRYPLAVLYTMASQNRNLRKFAVFSGTINACLDVHLSWRGGNAQKDFESLADAVEETVYRVFNSPDWAPSYNAAIYNGDLTVQRRPLEMAGQHWRQTLSFRLTFEADTE